MPSEPKRKNSLSEEIEKDVTAVGAILSRAGILPPPETPVELSDRTKAMLESIREQVHNDPTPEQAKRIAILIPQLGEGEGEHAFEKREEASAGLGELKYVAKSALEVAKNDPDPEIRDRANRLLKTLTEKEENLVSTVIGLRTIPLRECKTAWKTASPDLVSLLAQTDNVELQREIYTTFLMTAALETKEAPALMEIFKDSKRTLPQRHYAIQSLESVAPNLPDAEAKEVVSSFTSIFEGDITKDIPLKRDFIEVLGYIGPRANAAVPGLENIVTDDSYPSPLRREAIDSLIKIIPGMSTEDVKSIVSKIIEPTIDPKTMILLEPAKLSEGFEDDGTKKKDISVTLLEQLGKFGANAQPAVPKLIEILKADVANNPIKDRTGDCLKTIARNLSNEDLKTLLDALIGIAKNTKNEGRGRFVALDVIGSLGARAKSVIPDLEKLTRDNDAKMAVEDVIDRIKTDKVEKESSPPIPPPPRPLPLPPVPREFVPSR